MLQTLLHNNIYNYEEIIAHANCCRKTEAQPNNNNNIYK